MNTRKVSWSITIDGKLYGATIHANESDIYETLLDHITRTLNELKKEEV